MSSSNVNICSLCNEEIEEEKLAICKNCNNAYHKECLAKRDNVCEKCGYRDEENTNDINELQEVDLSNKITFCPKCGVKVDGEQVFCSSCGYKLSKHGNKNKLLLFNKKYLKYIVGLLLVISIVAIGISTSKSSQEKEIVNARIEYLNSVKNFKENVIVAGANLEDIADTYQDYWYDSIFNDKYGGDINEAALTAMFDKSDEIDQANEYHENIKDLYTKLNNIPEGNEDLSEVLDMVNNVYNSYTNLYDFALYPSGNFNQFCERKEDKIDKFMDDYRRLENYMEVYDGGESEPNEDVV